MVQVDATDPDLGKSGEVTFDFADTKKVKRFGLHNQDKVFKVSFLQTSSMFKIDKMAGTIATAVPLTGKGRQVMLTFIPFVILTKDSF